MKDLHHCQSQPGNKRQTTRIEHVEPVISIAAETNRIHDCVNSYETYISNDCRIASTPELTRMKQTDGTQKGKVYTMCDRGLASIFFTRMRVGQ